MEALLSMQIRLMLRYPKSVVHKLFTLHPPYSVYAPPACWERGRSSGRGNVDRGKGPRLGSQLGRGWIPRRGAESRCPGVGPPAGTPRVGPAASSGSLGVWLAVRAGLGALSPPHMGAGLCPRSAPLIFLCAPRVGHVPQIGDLCPKLTS